MNSNNYILFYDGDCGFCNSAVQFVLKHKSKNTKIKFSPLQSEFAQQTLKNHQINIKLDTLYLLTPHKVYDKSSAAILVCKHLKFPYNLLLSFYIIPKLFRDFIYKWISKNRFKLQSPSCLIPNKSDESRFIY
jgi:predicted DCC family thiol-disulfide oxidoreductase YuxK